MKYKYALFDLDGTLTDPGEGITNSVAYALEKFGVHVEDKTSLYKFIGPPLKIAFAEYYGFTPEKALLGVKYYREYFDVHGIFQNKVYDKVPEMLERLTQSGIKVILATSKPEIAAKRILDHFNLAKYFSYAAGATLDGTRSEKADVIAYALESAGVENFSDAIMVGDRKHDVLGAKKVGLDCIGVTYGYGTREELEECGAKYIVEAVEDVIKYI